MKINWTRVIVAILMIAICIYGTTMLFRRFVAPDVTNGKCLFLGVCITTMLIKLFVDGNEIKED